MVAPLLALLLQAAAPSSQEIRREESVDVHRVVVEVRVLDRGRALRGLGLSDFRLEVDGRPVAIESVHWVEPTPASGGAARATERAVVASPLAVLFFQKGLETSRAQGLLRGIRVARTLLDRLPPETLVAVASHDHRLHVWLDFTADRQAVRRAMDRSVLHGRPPGPAAAADRSLREHLDPQAARDAAAADEALHVLAAALRPLAGAKSLVMFGWGMGQLERGGVRMSPDYGAAQAALRDAGVAVFSLDTIDADYHSLEAGLQQVAGDTGGFYARTHLFPGAALRRLEAALEGHYILAFQRPALRKGDHRIRIRLGRRGEVLARPGYSDP